MNWRELLDLEVETLTNRIAQMGGEAEKSVQEIRDYAAAQADSLSAVVGQPGFAEASRAASLNTAGFAALKGVQHADELDAIAREAWVSGLASALRITAGIIASL